MGTDAVPRLWEKHKSYYSKPLLGATDFARESRAAIGMSGNGTRAIKGRNDISRSGPVPPEREDRPVRPVRRPASPGCRSGRTPPVGSRGETASPTRAASPCHADLPASNSPCRHRDDGVSDASPRRRPPPNRQRGARRNGLRPAAGRQRRDREPEHPHDRPASRPHGLAPGQFVTGEVGGPRRAVFVGPARERVDESDHVVEVRLRPPRR